VEFVRDCLALADAKSREKESKNVENTAREGVVDGAGATRALQRGFRCSRVAQKLVSRGVGSVGNDR
jgi:hypothetical protein